MKTIEVKGITKAFGSASVLKGVSFHASAGSSLAIMGSSGEGKTSLLHILGGLDSFDKGSIHIMGKDLAKDPLGMRRKHIGFIFQSYQLLDEFSLLDNILMPFFITKNTSFVKAHERAEALLQKVNLHKKKQQKAALLSGGEKQRAAIARALMNNPDILLADEPTGNLDRQHSEEIYDLLLSCAHELGKTVVIVTHDEQLASLCQEKRLLQDGLLR